MNCYLRKTVSLDGPWHFHVDHYRLGERRALWELRTETKRSGPVDWSPEDWPTITVPGDWNTQAPELLNYEGVGWYVRWFDAKPKASKRYVLRFGAVNYRARVFLNGEELGAHEGGFTPFSFEVTGKLKKRNALVVMADSTTLAEGIPTEDTDWYNYGGITRSVRLVELPKGFVSDLWVRLEEGKRGPRVVVDVKADGIAPGTEAVVRIPDLGAEAVCSLSKSGRGRARMPFTGERWSPSNPRLYRVEVQCGGDAVADEVGLRTVATDGNRILLNGESIYLRGMSCHEEAAPGRRGLTDADISRLMRHARDLNVNFLRLAHYPHDEAVARAADRAGVLLWEEVPVYWQIHFQKPKVLRLAKQQLTELVTRDRNRASVILWSMANETPEKPARTRFIRAEAEHVRRLDPTRLITAACFIRRRGTRITLPDPLFKWLDVVGINEYMAWYGDLLPRELRRYTWQKAFPKPVIVSELGAGAAYGHHGRADQRWTEEYQEAVYREQFAMLEQASYIRGMTPWILFDFRAPHRFNKWQRGFNRKGLLDNTRRRKKAFFFVRDYYGRKKED